MACILLKRLSIYRRSQKLFFSTPHAQILSEVIPVNVILVILVMEEPALILTSVLLNLIIANQGLIAKTLLVDSHAKI